MRTLRNIYISLFVITSPLVSAQDLFEFVRQDNHKGVKEYTGAVNLRDSNQATPLMWAVYSSDLSMVKLLIRKGADVTLKGWILFTDSVTRFDFIYGSCLAIAAGKNELRTLKYFIRKKNIPVDDRELILNDYEENGWTALHWAAVMGNNRAIRYLVRKGAEIDAISENDFNQTALLFAINFKRISSAKCLIKRGADVNRGDVFGVSPLTYALEIQNRELVKILLQHGATLEKNADRPIEEFLLENFGVKRPEDL